MESNVGKQDVIQNLAQLAFGDCGDAVKLLYFGPEELGNLDKLELRHIAEIHRAANGAMVIKFVSRLELLKLLAELMQDDDGDAGLLGALNDAAAALQEGGREA